MITVFSYLDSITLWHYNGTEAGAAVVKTSPWAVCCLRLSPQWWPGR
ncbi:hypothetical protein ACVXG8_02530 [Escherichia coli]